MGENKRDNTVRSMPQTSYGRCQELRTITPPESVSLNLLAVLAAPHRWARGSLSALTHVHPCRLSSRRLSQMLARHHGEINVLVIGDVAAPHHEDDLHPLRC